MSVHAQAPDRGPPADPLTLTKANGPIDVISGDGLWIGILRLRLHGIEAPKASRPCLRDGRDQGCAAKSRALLAAFARRDAFRCELATNSSGRARISGNRYLATCHADTLNVNEELVAQGWALAKGKSGRRYLQAENAARAKGLGVHGTNYVGNKTADKPSRAKPKSWWERLYEAAVDVAKRFPLLGIVAPWCIAISSLLLIIAVRWRARRQVARLQYELGKHQGFLEATDVSPPKPEPIRKLDEP